MTEGTEDTEQDQHGGTGACKSWDDMQSRAGLRLA
jgi:hypothetical protein